MKPIARRGDTVALAPDDAKLGEDFDVMLQRPNEFGEIQEIGPYRWQSLLARGYWDPI